MIDGGTGKPSSASGGRDMDPGEFFASLQVLVFLIPVGGALALGVLTDWAQWAVDHGILVAAAADPLLTIPLAEGAGLDTRRIVIAVVALIAVTVAVSTLTRPYRERAQLRAMRQGDMS